jgi:tRNA threonylcarbamoyladenosine modification (KEOPS) complex Cgi121 subunit
MRAHPTLQVVNAGCVFGGRHLASAVIHARLAHHQGSNRARDLRTEVLMYLTGQRQVADAIRIGGLARGRVEAVAISFSGRPALARIASAEGWERDDSLLHGRVEDLPAAGFTAVEIGTALDPLLLPLERTALLVVQR